MVLKFYCGIKRGLHVLRARCIASCIRHSSSDNFLKETFLKNKYKSFLYRLNENQFNFQFHQCKSFYSTHNKGHIEKEENLNDKQIVYFGKHGSFLKGLKVFSLSTSLITVLVQPLMYSTISSMSTPGIIVSYCMIGCYVFATPLLIYSMARKYVTEIVYDSINDSYILKTLTFFFRNKTVHFKIEDVKKDESGMFVSFTIKGKPRIIFEEGFLDKSHFIKMMGYDKPLDLEMILGKRLEGNNEEEKSQT